MIFIGDDWAEAHHDVEVQDEAGVRLMKGRLPEGLDGIRRFHELVAGHAQDPGEVVIGIETDRGLWVQALVAAGYQVFAINPFAASRYRERHTTSGAKSDPGDAKVLADLVRTDRQHHRQVAGDSTLAESIKVLARSHQNLVWARRRQGQVLRSTLREYYPAALEAFGDALTSTDALSVLAAAPTPDAGRSISVAHVASALRRGGRQRRVQPTAERIRAELQRSELTAPPALADAYGASVTAMVAVLSTMSLQLAVLEAKLSDSFEKHPDAEILLSQPGLGVVLGARVLGEFGDDRSRYIDARARKCYAGTAPITKASGTRHVVLARVARNRRLADACYWWAFSAINVSPGARALYDALRKRGATHHQGLRAVGNRLVGILHGCLHHRSTYSEAVAWPAREPSRNSADDRAA